MTPGLARSLAKADAAVPVGWKQLCAITRSVYEPAIDDAEWAGRIKDRVVTLGFLTPRADEITKAIRAVERTVNRPLPVLTMTRHTPEPAPRPLSRDEAHNVLADIQRRFERTRHP